VSHGRVGSDEEVQICEHRRRFHERTGLLIEAPPQVFDRKSAREGIELLEPRILPDSTSDSSNESQTDADLEAADVSTDTITDTENDIDSDNETDTDTGSSGSQDIVVYGADMDELSGSSTASESDTATDSDTNVDTATTTASESTSFSQTDDDETTTDSELDESTETDTTTDTDDDSPVNTEESSESDGIQGLILSGASTDTVDDTATLGESDDDSDVDTSTGTDSDTIDGGLTAGENDNAVTTSTASMTETGSDTGTDTTTEVASQILGVSGVITGGGTGSTDSGDDSGSWDMTGGGSNSVTTSLSGVEADAGDDVSDSESTQESGSTTSSGSADEDSTEFESMTESLGDGGAIVGGGSTESTSEIDGSAQTSTETDDASTDMTGGDQEQMLFYAGYLNSSGATNSGSGTLTDAATAAEELVDDLSEAIGADGVVSSGDESESLDELSGNTATETDYPTDTTSETQIGDYLEPVLSTTTTLSETDTDTSTGNESDEDWATETLGTGATIASGSDCFTVDEADSTNDSSTGSGPEDYNDTSDEPNGQVTLDGSGASSSLVHQEFGDILGSGGAISSGSLSYTDSTSESDEQTTTESGTESVADPVDPYRTGQMGLYTVTTSRPDDETAFETGTETLGVGGMIMEGSDSYSWSEGDLISRDLTVTNTTTVLDVLETATDTFGFGESGTETFGAGGADEPGSASFDWIQAGTDTYGGDQGLSDTTSAGYGPTDRSFTYELTDTVSSSWHDDGIDELGDGDSLTGESDSYAWNDVDSFSYSLVGGQSSYVASSGSNVFAGEGTEAGSGFFDVSTNEAGTDMLAPVEGDYDYLTIAGGTATYTVTDSGSNTISDDASVPIETGFIDSTFDSVSVLSIEEIGSLSQSGSLTGTSDSETTDYFAGTSYGWNYSEVDAESATSVGGGYESGTGSGDTDSTYASSISQEYAEGTLSYENAGFSTLSSSATVNGPSSTFRNEFGVLETGGSVAGEGDFNESSTLSEGGTDTGSDGEGSYSYYNLSQFTEAEAYTGSDTSGPCCPSEPVSWDFQTQVIQALPLDTVTTGEGNESEVTVTGDHPSTLVTLEGPAPIYPSGAACDSIVAIGDSADYYLPYQSTVVESHLSEIEILVYPDTDPMTADGLPAPELSETLAANDGVSRDAPPSPTATLIALAAAGRNPTDITLPTVGSDASDSGGGGSGGSGSGGGGMDVRRSNGTTAGAASGSGVLVAQGALSLPGDSTTASPPAGTSNSIAANGPVAATAGSTSSSTSVAKSGASTTGSPTSSSGTTGASGEAVAGNGSGASGSSTTVVASTSASSSAQSTASPDDVEPADDPAPAQGSNLSPNWEGFKAGAASVAGNISGAVYGLFTGQTGAALGERAYQKAQQRGIENPNAVVVVGLVGEDMIGAQAVEGISGYDLATSQPIPGELFDGGERSQRLASGSAAFLGSAAAGTGLVARFTPLGQMMRVPVEAAPVAKTPLEIQAEGYGAAAEAGPVPPASARTPLPAAEAVAPETGLSLPGRVQSRINLSNEGWDHVVKRHFSGKPNASQFTVTQDELRGVLQSEEVVNTPITRTLQSTEGTLYVREVDLGRQIGLDKFTNMNPTNVVSVVTDKFGNLKTVTPGIIK
jgi:hypothetical protein